VNSEKKQIKNITRKDQMIKTDDKLQVPGGSKKWLYQLNKKHLTVRNDSISSKNTQGMPVLEKQKPHACMNGCIC
jgi:hypothetical protein